MGTESQDASHMVGDNSATAGKPIYRKKRVIIPAAVLMLAAVSQGIGGVEPSVPATENLAFSEEAPAVEEEVDTATDAQTESPEEESIVEPALPSTEYSIEVVEESPQTKLSLAVALPERISDEALALLAEQVFAEFDGGQYERTFIEYMLPGESDRDPLLGTNTIWATTHFRPDMELGILQSSLDEHTAGNELLDSLPGQELGRWDSNAGLETHSALFLSDEGQHEFIVLFEGSSISSIEVDVSEVDGGLRLDSSEIDPNAESAHIFIDAEGYLTRANQDGVWFKSRQPSSNS